MINLISYDKRTNIKAGRINVILLRYTFMVVAANILIVATLIGAYFTLSLANDNAQRQVAENEQSTAAFKAVEQQANTFRSDLSIAKGILDKEIAYSKLILKIAGVIPDRVILESLSLDSATLGTPTTISAKAKDTPAAVEFSKRFKKETGLFSDVKLDSIEVSEEKTEYPVTVVLGLTIKKEVVR